MKNKSENEQIIKSIEDIAKFSEIESISIMESVVMRNGKSQLGPIMCNYMIDNNIESGTINYNALYELYTNYFEEFKAYFDQANESSKLNILGTMPRAGIKILKGDDYTDVVEMLKDIPEINMSYYEKDLYRNIYLGKPMEFFRSLGFYQGPDDERLNIAAARKSKFLFNTIEKYAPFYFKYIELGQISKGTIYADIKYQLISNDSDSYVMKAILKRIELSNEKPLRKNTVKAFVDFINTPGRVSDVNRRLIMESLNEHVSTKIMIDVTL